ncbi:MAG: peptide ABC transporter substrate-binding protein, partial [Candidatus Falkowbacteria bacterium]|nr:peptide ABC transporter substrate-binding protein [Candidatus Falkowbacteria bacterium]
MPSNNQNKDDLDKLLVHSLSKSRIPSFRQLKFIKKVVSSKELMVLRFSLLGLFCSLIFIFSIFLYKHVDVKPAIGGEYTEGVVGSPKYINPLYASLRDVDSDIASLVYSSLFKRNKDGVLEKDLASDYTVSDDGLEYTITVRDDARWQNDDKSNVTVDDVIYTFNLIKDASYQSPLRISFSGVEVERIDDSKIKFTLSKKYSAFLSLLDFGILPQDLWYQIPTNSFGLAELNLKPVGSGPYKFKSLAKDKSGIVKLYNLTYNDNYYGKSPYVRDVSFKFFPSYEEVIQDLGTNAIDGISYLPPSYKKSITVKDPWYFHNLGLSELTGLFFNQDKNKALAEKNIRVALTYAIDKDKIINDLGGEYKAINGPILENNFAYNKDIKKINFDRKKAADLLEISGWSLVKIGQEELLSDEESKEKKTEKKNSGATGLVPTEELVSSRKILGEGSWLTKRVKGKDTYLIINLVTVDTPENVLVVNYVKSAWESIGVKTIINIVPANQIQSDTIKARNYDVLFYGEALSTDPDIYAYWHSSQIGKNGLNLAGYKNDEVDKLLIEARETVDQNERIAKYQKIQAMITE